jgi:YlmC/YmxH family sporulation protein
MELSFSELRAKEVINTQDGRRLGRVCDIALCYPDNKWIGIIVPNGRGFMKRNDLFISLKNIVKIGEDVILVNIGVAKTQTCDKRKQGASSDCGCFGGDFPMHHGNGGRNYEEYE